MTPSYYAIIPAEVRYADIPANAKLLYGEITALANKTGECYASNTYFASLYGVTERQITRRLKYLTDEDFIFIYIDKSQGNKRSIGIDKNVYSSRQKSLKVWTKKSIPIDKNVGYNNIYNNTYNNTNNNIIYNSNELYIEGEGGKCLEGDHDLDTPPPSTDTPPPSPSPQARAKRSIVNTHNRDEAIVVYDTIKNYSQIVDGTLDDCVALASKLKKLGSDPGSVLSDIIQAMQATGQDQYYSIASPSKLYHNLGTIYNKIKANLTNKSKPAKQLKVY